MELTGVISALRALKEPCIVELYSDSKYVVDALSKGWAVSWRRNGWKKADKKPALNSELWAELLELCDKHEVRCHWVKGHAEGARLFFICYCRDGTEQTIAILGSALPLAASGTIEKNRVQHGLGFCYSLYSFIISSMASEGFALSLGRRVGA